MSTSPRGREVGWDVGMDAGDGTWPLTYVECRERFRRAATAAGAELAAHPIAARGPAGEELTIDVAVLGRAAPTRALFVPVGDPRHRGLCRFDDPVRSAPPALDRSAGLG